MLIHRIWRAAVFALAIATPVAAQNPSPDTTTCMCRNPGHHDSEFARRSSGSFAITQSRPMGALKNNIGLGYGASGAYMFRLDHAGVLSLRAEVAMVDYGDESMRVPLSPTIGGRIQVKVVTSNYVVPVSIGPQLMWPTGLVRPYVTVGIGGQYFYTDSHIDGTDEDSHALRTTNQSDWTSTWVAGGGVYVPLTNKRRINAAIDLGVQFVNGGHAQYLRPGSIEDLPNSQLRITPLESDTRMTLVRLGVRVGL